MITLNQTAGNNNETIWVLKINTDTPIYLATRDLSLTNTYDGQVLNYENYLTDLSYESNIKESGGTGAVTSFGFSISRHISNALLSSFFDEFYPATSGVYLTSRLVQIGICWVGASADTDITWLFAGRVISYDFEQRKMNVLVFQESEITNKEIPYYSVQKDFNNEVSYFPNAPQDSFGLTIPVVYGDLSKGTNPDGTDYGLYLGYTAIAPCIPISKRLTRFIVCSHKVFESSQDVAGLGSVEWLFKYIPNLQAYLWIKNNVGTDSSTVNNDIRHYFSMTDRGSRLVGTLIIRLTDQSEMSDIDDIDNAVDQDNTTYSTLTANATGDQRLGLKCIGSVSTSDIGYLGIDDADIFVFFTASTDGGGNRNFTVNYYNNTLQTPAGDASPSSGTLTSGTASDLARHSFGTDTNGKKDATLPWTIEEVTSLDYYIENDQTTGGEDIYVYKAFLQLSNIKVFAPNFGRSIRQEGGVR